MSCTLVEQANAVERLQAGVDSLPVLGSLILAYIAHQGGRIPKGSNYLADSRNFLNELSSRLPWLKSMLDGVSDSIISRTTVLTFIDRWGVLMRKAHLVPKGPKAHMTAVNRSLSSIMHQSRSTNFATSLAGLKPNSGDRQAEKVGS